MSLPVLQDLVLLCFVALAAATDLAVRKIPNLLVLGGLAAALGLQLLPGASTLAWLGGALTGLLLLLPLYLLRGMAAGDVKLMAMVGAFTGPLLALQIAGATCLIGGLMALLIVCWRGCLYEAAGNVRALLARGRRGAAPAPAAASVGGMPYGVAIALATALLVWWSRC
ncbi:prepilin peptidase [Janthinobacterium fluminis]|uniref:Prepilin peptidase n=1 Tax=Janthinobacterium fluminis TaxID=2987524 RepID=A0ABT5KAN5_9BURK|nr:prepilin peptidase [Janthinobacterium fluminis]MDC8760887.1 prepilin peptidase [Janthinobacterium fluminis]